MGYSSSVVRRARDRLSEEVRRKERLYREHLDMAYAQEPRLRELDRALRGTAAQAVATALSHGEDPVAAIQRLKEKNLELQRQRQWVIDCAEWEEDFLDDGPLCPKCSDNGFTPDGRMCDCLRERCCQVQLEDLAPLLNSGASFDGFDLQFYDDLPYGPSPRQLMREALRAAKSYAETFGSHGEHLLFAGATGLGKTYLAGCIARRVTERGFGVTYGVSPQVLAHFEEVKFGRAEPEELEKYLGVDLLILDDLGTEAATAQNVSFLFQLLNTRLTEQKCTLVTTNLDPDRLGDRYSPQIASRLKGDFRLIPFLGNDVRTR